MRLSKKNTGNPAHWTILLMKWALMCRDEGYVYSKQARKAWDTDTMKAVLEEWAGETQRSDYGTEIKLNLHMKDHRYLDYYLRSGQGTPRVLDGLGDADARDGKARWFDWLFELAEVQGFSKAILDDKPPGLLKQTGVPEDLPEDSQGGRLQALVSGEVLHAAQPAEAREESAGPQSPAEAAGRSHCGARPREGQAASHRCGAPPRPR